MVNEPFGMSIRWWIGALAFGAFLAIGVLLDVVTSGWASQLPTVVEAAVAFVSGVALVWLLEAVVSAVRWLGARAR